MTRDRARATASGPDRSPAHDSDVRRVPSRRRASFLLIGALLVAACRPGVPDDVTGPDPTPSAPSDLTVTATASDRIDLDWSPPASNAAAVIKYRVYRDGEIVGEPTGTSHTDRGLSSFTEYEYRVTAMDSSGTESEPTATVTAKTLDGSAPPPPSDLDVSATGPSEVELNWSAASDPETGIAEYRVYRDGSVVGTAEDTEFTDTGLDPDTEYVYGISAVNGEGLEGPTTDPAMATTEAEADESPPTAPGDLDASATGPSEVELNWSAASDPESGITEYRVYRNGDLVGTSESTTFTDTGLDPDTEYVYEVSAVNGEGLEGPKSDPATATTEAEADESPPTAPGDLDASATGPSEVELNWSAASDPESGITEYRVYRNGDLVGTSESTTFTDTGLDPDTEYVYEVSAVNGEGLEGPKSDPATATTEAEADESPPTAPGDLDASATGPSEVELDWSAASDPESGIAEYRVYRDGSVVGTAEDTEFTDTDLEPFTKYDYEVSAVNGEGLEGPKSERTMVRTEKQDDDDDDDDEDGNGLVAGSRAGHR